VGLSDLLVRPNGRADDGTLATVTPDSAGWGYVGFEVLELGEGQVARRDTGVRELCVVVVSGRCHVRSKHGEWRDLGGRPDPWSGPPEAAYLPPGTTIELQGAGHGAAAGAASGASDGSAVAAEVALCWAPAGAGAPARVLPADGVEVEVRGAGPFERRIQPILMVDKPADSLLVVEVITPGGHWSSYPPHKHDRDAMPDESFLEETYYYRVAPAHGFGLQRVYTADGALDESFAVRDRDTVLVPRGYHTVSAPPGYDLYYLNVMAGPTRAWAIANDPDHEWMLR
jgi:5-deoxy-glucuronate isomerase